MSYTMAQVNETTKEDENWDHRDQKSNEKENKTTTETKVTKVVAERLDTNQ